ncbi:transcriptional regulator [Bernardetia litoralis DSM 6794]|uniref:Transcriptional regulator n=1 Tax=Bernardetia litoralis (strain ATCC 23117 / DSM 6794 / NBRC 15988 / NCIMB 1366 / Fx l1 / Sio-4) TaxID=880071 RepID=I4AMD5_BERLS|nr:TetR/AcrR family transcriptional regulator [Bernardetia litoralis]AFM05120.1 transcriptional regulator [Bernardetia litoralis DSM 6794]
MKLKSAEKEERIYEVVLELTQKVGLAGLRISDIAKEADLAHGTLYIYFKNKKELINQLYKKIKSKVSSELLPENIQDYSIKDGMFILWKNYLHYLVNNQQKIHFMTQCGSSNILNEENKSISDSLMKKTNSFFQKGIDLKDIKDVEIELLISIFRGMIENIALQITQKKLDYTPKLIENSFEIYWHGIRK